MPYKKRVEDLVGSLPLPEGLGHIMVRHDDWCAVMKGLPFCTCDPTVEVLDEPPVGWKGPKP